MADVTLLLSAVARGDPRAAAELLPLVYSELRVLASVRMAKEAPDHTLQPTALVHEAYLRLTAGAPQADWNGRGHFFAAAAEAMRRILVDEARRRTAAKRGGAAARILTDPDALAAPGSDEQILAVHEALEQLAEVDPQAARLVQLRFFGGLSAAEAAAAMGISVRAAHDVWAYARAWLHRRLAAGYE
jgi:RNA polymerase sigma factor (TIGR02999 family)